MGTRRNPDGWGSKARRWRDRWRAYLTLDRDETGHAKRKYVYGRTEAECLAKLDELRRQKRDGAITDNTLTLTRYLEEWLQQKALEVSPRTVKIYRDELRHVAGRVGGVKLGMLTPLHIQRVMRQLHGLETKTVMGKRVVRRTLTARAANKARSVLHNALADAVRLGLIPSNPAARVKPVREEPKELSIWTAQQVLAFLDCTLANRAAQHAMFYLALTTGLRSGELMALEWRDLTGSKLHVRRTVTRGGKTSVGIPKHGSARVLELPGDALQTLRAHRAGVQSEGIDSPLLFPTRTGGMVSHSNFRKALRGWAVQAGVPIIRPHDLRHTYASMAIANGSTPAELARQLGHRDASFTLRRYVHLFERYTPRSAATLEALTGREGGTDRGYEAGKPN